MSRPFHIGKKIGRDGGFSLSIPPGWDDGSGKVKHIPSGPHKGRVYFESRHEARELAKRIQDKEQRGFKYDPD